MAKELIVTGLDGIVWGGTGILKGMYHGVYNYGFRDEPPYPKNRGHTVRAIGEAITGRSVGQVAPLVRDISRTVVRRANSYVLGSLRQFPSETYELVGLTSAPDFVVRSALDLLRIKTGITFSDTHLLATQFEVEDDRFTGRFDLTPKNTSVAALLEDTGVDSVKLGMGKGNSDRGWLKQFCEATVLFGPDIRKTHIPRPNELPTTQPVAP